MIKKTKIKRLISLKFPSIDDQLEFVEARFKDNSIRLLTYLGIKPAQYGTFCCDKCTSGTGTKRTGMYPHHNKKGQLRFHCFVCDNSFRPVEAVMRKHPNMKFRAAVEFLYKFYLPEYDPEYDRELPMASCRFHSFVSRPLEQNDRLIATYAESVSYRMECPSWQQAVADALGLPFDALSRPDIGKAFVADSGRSPDAGDLVTYNLVNKIPHALKVRHIPGIGDSRFVHMLDTNENVFRYTYNDGSRAFRMAGPSGAVCFGHDFVTQDIATVVITEGQSDVLAVCAAAAALGKTDLTAIGRDSASHVLQPIDLDVLAGKRIIYCEDDDIAGRRKTQENIALLESRGCTVFTWSPSADGCKDARDVYRNLGPHALITSLLNNAQ